MTDRELLEQALKALKLAYAGIDAITVHGKAITALEQRLAQPERVNQCGETCERAKLCATCARGLDEQPQRTHWEGCEEVHPECRKQEPIAWVTGWHDGHCVIRAVDPALMLPVGAALYTAPQRQLQGLTEEEIKALPQWYPSHETAAVLPLIRAVEAKLREKNNG